MQLCQDLLLNFKVFRFFNILYTGSVRIRILRNNFGLVVVVGGRIFDATMRGEITVAGEFLMLV